MKQLTIALIALTVMAAGCTSPVSKTSVEEVKTTPEYTGEAVTHEFAALPYAYDALEPYIDAQTMEIHYSLHHQGYYNNFIKAVEATGVQNASLAFIFENISTLSSAVKNNAGGYFNHSFFWSVLAPAGSGGEPSEALSGAINNAFGSLEGLKEKFNAAATGQFGSGWSWLVVQEDGTLAVTGSANQENPLMDISEVKGQPILAIDVWEHAYYLKYKNKRADYVQNFWNIVNWNEVNRLYQEAL